MSIFNTFYFCYFKSNVLKTRRPNGDWGFYKSEKNNT